jgi:serralysin
MSTIYVSPTGSGTGTGLTAGNALSATQLNKAISLAGPGGTVMMLADQGAYNINGSIAITHGGLVGAPVTVMGVDSAGHAQNIVINGTRPADYAAGNPPGNEIFKLFAGADNLVFENMTFNNVSLAFRACADISNITVQHMTADNVRHFFEDYASGTATTATVSGLTIQDVDVHGFSKAVIRLQYDTHDVVIRDVYGDSEHQDGDGIAMGIHLDDTVHHVSIIDSTMENAIATNNTYWNGDGFTTERGVYDVTFQNCVARGNADGGFDLKSTGTKLIDCIAEDNGRNFRLWGEATLINPTGLDPHKVGGSGGQYQIQILNGAKVTVTGGQFTDSGSSTVVVVNDGGVSITFNGTDFVHADGGKMKEGTAIFGLDPALIHTVTATGTYSTDGAVPSLNQAPDAASFAGGAIPENAPAGTLVGTVTGHDPNAGDTLRYSLLDNAGGRFTINAVTGAVVVASGAVLDYEQQRSFNITVAVTDSHGLSLTKAATVALQDVVESGGSQTLTGTTAADVLNATSDSDFVVNGLAGNDQITTRGGNDTITGGAGNDTISAGAGNDVIKFSGTGGGFDNVSGGAGSDIIQATAKGTVIGLQSVTEVEKISANGFTGVTIKGSAAADTFDFTNVTLDGIKSIGGGAGNDTITGSSGNDVLSGDAGADRLSGGGGSDLFSYSNATHSKMGGADTIVDFTVGADKFDLSGIDASTTLTGNQAFVFVDNGAFTGVAGQLRVDASDPNVTHIYGDTNGDMRADFQIDVLGHQPLHATDFIL